jgi:hypothetical protein
MATKKISRKALKTLLNESIREGIGRLELPPLTKKVKKLINKSSKLIASEFIRLLKKEKKKAGEQTEQKPGGARDGKKKRKSRKKISG